MKYLIKVIGNAYPNNKFGLWLNDINHIEKYYGNKIPKTITDNDNFIINEDTIYILSVVALNIEYIYAYIYYLSMINPIHQYDNSEKYKIHYDKYKEYLSYYFSNI